MLILTLTLLLSCKNEMTICLSSSPDAAFFAEQFNSAQNREKVQFIYTDDSKEYLKNNSLTPDIIIDWNINNSLKQLNFNKLNRLVKDESDYYKQLMESGKDKNRQRMIPLSFNLPCVSFKHTPGLPEYPISITLDEISIASSAFNKENNREYLQVGFYPAWERSSLFLSYKLLGLKFIPKEDAFIVDRQSLIDSQKKLNTWLAELAPFAKKEQIFRDKFINKPGYLILSDQKVLFYYYSSQDYFTINEKDRTPLLYSWISDGTKIEASAKILYAAIPEKVENSAGATAFLRWILNKENQKKILMKKNSTGINSFGLFNGFSSIKSVNEDVYAQLYPQLKDRFPIENEINFPNDIPLGLIAASDSIISQWMYQELNKKNEFPLPVELDKWVKQQPDLR